MKRRTPDRPCYACETGIVRPTNLRGRAMDYRDARGLVIDEDLILPACDAPDCGELLLGTGDTTALTTVLERLRAERKRQAVERFTARAAADFPDVPRGAWEDLLGLSRGYLSRLASGTRLPDTALEIVLTAFARDPRAALRVFELAGRDIPRR
jgi:hypothetical protein